MNSKVTTPITVLDVYQRYIALSRYSRYLPDKKRRETWEETVQRYVNFWDGRFGDTFPKDEIYNAIYSLKVMPSMRALMTAGKALDRDEISGYNCSSVAVDDPRVFDEALFVLMNGTGLGFSVERQFVNKLPEVPEELYDTDTTIVVKDSKLGWASAYRELIAMLYAGKIPRWDLSQLRPAGAPLKVFGGRSSGPDPLDDLFKFTINTFKKSLGRKMTSLECHDIMCMIGTIVLVGGVRRAALISLSNLSDDRMRAAKSGQWWVDTSYRALANNSAAYTEKPDIGVFMKEWLSLYESKSGERGIINRYAMKKKIKAIGRRKAEYEFLVNPCSEIFLRAQGLCNLSEVVIRSGDTLEMLIEKVKTATIIGTFQSTLTNFRYLRSIWKKNAEEERLLGVSLTGIMDHEILQNNTEETKKWLNTLRETAIETNEYWANKLGINPSVAITCAKPSGTVSQLVDASSGIHARLSKFYIRRVRNDKKDPLSEFMIGQGIPYEEDAMNSSSWVFSFPCKAPDTTKLASEMSAIEQLEHYKTFLENWAEHNISVTIYVKEHEWLKVGTWVYENFDVLAGVSFLPYSEHNYVQAPYEPITEETYNKLKSNFPDVNYSYFNVNEHSDNTKGVQQLACSSGVCEIL